MNPISLLAHPYTVTVARLLLAGVLLASGFGKLLDRGGLVEAVAAYRILPARLTRPFAAALPHVEILIGCAVLVGLWTRAAAVLAVALLASFTIAVAVNLTRGNTPDCHCFGALHRESIRPVTLLRLLALILVGIEILRFADGYLEIGRWLRDGQLADGRLPSPIGLIPIVLGFAGLVLVASLIRRMRSLLVRPQVS